MTGLRRRELIASGAAGAGLLAFGPGFWRAALAGPVREGAGPYGPLGAADGNGLRLPAGFTSRVVARANQTVPGTAYPWHIYPDGQATFATDDGGWILVSNSESVAATGAGVSAIRFAADGAIRAAYRICAGTNANCAGGPTPWGTWLTCEEYDYGQVWECDPNGNRPALNRPAMGAFNHEAVAVDPVGKRLYMTEDEGDGGLYRFTPAAYPDLTRGLLEIAKVDGAGRVTWAEVPDPSATSGPTRRQVEGSARFKGGEGIWFDSGVVYFTTKGDDRVWAHDVAAGRVEVLFDPRADGSGALDGPDNLTVAGSGDLYVCEDNGEDVFSIRVLTPDGEIAPFVTFEGSTHAGSETAGVVFDPSGTRLYFSSQRGDRYGIVYEVTGPFRRGDRAGAPTAPGEGGGGAGTEEDTTPPGVRLDLPRRKLSARALDRRGLRVTVRVDEPAEIKAVLRTSDLARTRGKRGSTDRPVTVRLARERGQAERALSLRLETGKRGRKRLESTLRRRRRKGKRPRVRARLVVQAKDSAGNVRVANRRITITDGRRRRRA